MLMYTKLIFKHKPLSHSASVIKISSSGNILNSLLEHFIIYCWNQAKLIQSLPQVTKLNSAYLITSDFLLYPVYGNRKQESYRKKKKIFLIALFILLLLMYPSFSIQTDGKNCSNQTPEAQCRIIIIF